jgi:hypothetical protein
VVVSQTYYGLMSFLVMFREDDVYKFSDWAEAASKKKNSLWREKLKPENNAITGQNLALKLSFFVF